MRTLKKALSLVLVLAMVFALAVPGFAADTTKKASDFKDYSKVTNKEAVDVLTAIGVINGNADGTFAPEGNFTRAEAATLITYLTLGKTVADALPTGATQFTDVPATHWAAKYVQYCAQEGIVAGVGNGKFDPDAKLTATQWALMLLGALGYKAANEGIGGTGWEIATTKLAMTAGVATAEDLTATFNRDMAAKMAFKATKATMVEYTGGSTVTVNGVTFTSGATRKNVAQGSYTNIAAIDNAAAANQTLQLMEKVFPKMTATSSPDAIGHDGIKWTYNNKVVGTYATEASKTFVATKAYDGVVDAYKELFDKTSTQSSVTDKVRNGATWGGAIAIGDVIDLYIDNNGVVTKAVNTSYDCKEITDVSTTLTKAQKEAGATAKLKIDGVYYLNTAIEGYDAATYVKGAYVLFVKVGTKIVASEIAKTVTGEVTATKNGQASINGTFYTDAQSTKSDIGTKGTFYLGKADQIVASKAEATISENYAYVYNVTVADKANADGVTSKTVTLYYVTVDGTKASAVAKVKENATSHNLYLDKAGAEGQLVCDSTGSVTKDFVVAFELNSDKQFVQVAAKDNIVASAAKATNGVDKTHPVVDNSKVATDDTKFIFVKQDPTTKVYKTSVVTGYKNVNIANSADMTTVYNAKNQALYTFVAANNGNVTTNANLAVLLSKTATLTKDADKNTIYTYDAVVNGETTTLSFKGSAVSGAYDGMVIAYVMENNYAKIDTSISSGNFSSGVSTKADITAGGSDYFTTSAASYMSTTNAKVYTITVEFKSAADYKTYTGNDIKADGSIDYNKTTANQAGVTTQGVTVSEGASFDAHDWVVYTVSNGAANNVYVVEFVY